MRGGGEEKEEDDAEVAGEEYRRGGRINKLKPPMKFFLNLSKNTNMLKGRNYLTKKNLNLIVKHA